MDTCGSFAKLEHKLTRLTNNFESGGGVDIYGLTFSHDTELVQWFKDRNEKNAFFSMLWPCSSKLVLRIPLLNIPFMLKKLIKISFFGLILELLLGFYLVLACRISLLEIIRRQQVVLMNFWSDILRIISFGIRAGPKVLQVS